MELVSYSPGKVLFYGNNSFIFIIFMDFYGQGN